MNDNMTAYKLPDCVDGHVASLVQSFYTATTDPTQKTQLKKKAVDFIKPLIKTGQCATPKKTNMNYWNSNIQPADEIYKINNAEIGIKPKSMSSIEPNQNQNQSTSSTQGQSVTSNNQSDVKTYSCDAPSKDYCETGKRKPGEKFNQNIHNNRDTPAGRCSQFYDEYEIFHYIYNDDELKIYDAIGSKNIQKLKSILDPNSQINIASNNKMRNALLPTIYLLHSICPKMVVSKDGKKSAVYFTPFQYACYNAFYEGCMLILTYIIPAGKEEFIRQLYSKTFQLIQGVNTIRGISMASVNADDVCGKTATQLFRISISQNIRAVASKAKTVTTNLVGNLATLNLGRAVASVTPGISKFWGPETIEDAIKVYRIKYGIPDKPNISVEYAMYPHAGKNDSRLVSNAGDIGDTFPMYEKDYYYPQQFVDEDTLIVFQKIPTDDYVLNSGFIKRGGIRKTRKSRNKSNKRRTRSTR